METKSKTGASLYLFFLFGVLFVAPLLLNNSIEKQELATQERVAAAIILTLVSVILLVVINFGNGGSHSEKTSKGTPHKVTDLSPMPRFAHFLWGVASVFPTILVFTVFKHLL